MMNQSTATIFSYQDHKFNKDIISKNLEEGKTWCMPIAHMSYIERLKIFLKENYEDIEINLSASSYYDETNYFLDLKIEPIGKFIKNSSHK